MNTSHFLELVHQGGMTNYPLIVGSILALAIFFERLWRFRGLAAQCRALTRQVIDALVARDLDTAKAVCEKTEHPMGQIFVEAMLWRNVPLEDLEKVLATSRQEAAYDLKRGLWLVGTIGSLAPYVGLFGTVVGIIRAFQAMAAEGAGGFEVVAAGISEALIATAAGLAVAIIALIFFNYLSTRVGQISAVYARSCERFTQALVFVEASARDIEEGASQEVPDGQLVPAQ